MSAPETTTDLAERLATLEAWAHTVMTQLARQSGRVENALCELDKARGADEYDDETRVTRLEAWAQTVMMLLAANSGTVEGALIALEKVSNGGWFRDDAENG